MNKQVYIVEADFGSWDDAYTQIMGVYDDEYMAQQAVEQITEHFNNVKQLSQPPKRMKDQWHEWYHKTRTAKMFNEARIFPFTLNKEPVL